jgi:pimeloyl-ACP methyl ester carboxylesterase
MIQLSQAHLFYAQHQPQDAPQTLLLIHGAGGSHLAWPAALRRLPQTAVYTLDLAGHGRSHPPSLRTIEAYTQDVLDFIAALELENVVVLGHSMGGAIAQMVGLDQPSQVIGLVLVGTGAKLRVSPAILEAIQTNYEAAVDMLNQFYWSGTQNPDVAADYRRAMLACPPEVMFYDFLACDQFDVRDRLAEITLPTLVISASADQMIPMKFGQFLTEQLPQAEFAQIEQAGHMMTLEAPEQLTQLVYTFVQKRGIDK